MNPTILGVIGQGFLNQVPTLLGIPALFGLNPISNLLGVYCEPQALPEQQILKARSDSCTLNYEGFRGTLRVILLSSLAASSCNRRESETDGSFRISALEFKGLRFRVSGFDGYVRLVNLCPMWELQTYWTLPTAAYSRPLGRSNATNNLLNPGGLLQ